MCLWGCFWKRLKFELENWAEKFALSSVGGPHPISQRSTNRIKGWIRKNSFSLPEGFWAESFVFRGLLGFPRWCSGKESVSLCRRHGFDPWVGKIPGVGNGNPLQYSCLENSMNRGAWWAMLHGVTKSWTWLIEHTRVTINSPGCMLLSLYNHQSLFFSRSQI